MSDCRIVTEEILDNGLPCHKYILRKLATSVDAISFTKTYVNTMLSAGATYGEVEAALPLLSLKLPADSPIAGYDFVGVIEAGGDGLSFIDGIRFNEDIPTYKRCDKFYRKFEHKCYACLLCPMSSKYLNKNFVAEKAVLAYALSSPTALDYVKMKGVLPEHFKSVVDVLTYFAFGDRPCCYPLFSKTYLALMDDTIREDFFSRDERISFGDELLAYHSSCLSNGYIPKGLLSADLIIQLGEVLAEEIVTELQDALDGIDMLIAQVLNPESDADSSVGDMQVAFFSEADISGQGQSFAFPSVDKTVIAAESNMGVDSINAFYEEVPVKKKRRRKKKRNPSEHSAADVVGAVGIEECVEDAAPDVSLADVAGDIEELTLNDVLLNEDVATVQGVFEEPVAEANVYSPIGNRMLGSDEPVDAEIVHSFPFKRRTSSSADMADAMVVEEIGNLSDDSGKVRGEVSGDSMVVLPVVPTKELEHFCLSLDGENARMLALLESHVLKDKRLCMELIVTDADIVYLLLYSPRLRAYFYTDMGSAVVKEVVVPLLTRASISKFCYYPFPLVSALWKMGIYIKGVSSLFSMGAVLFGDHHMDISFALQEMGAVRAVGGVTIKPEGVIDSIPLLYMHSYPTIYHRGRQALLRKGLIAEYEERSDFDVLLGFSYYQNKYIESGSVLFSLVNANSYCFNSSVYANLTNGSCVKYTFSDIPVSASTVVRALLCRLETLGKFKQYRIMVVNVTGHSFTLYVDNNHFRNISSVVNTMLLAYLRECGLHGLDYSVERI